jgi:hypothetical protein
MTTSTWIDVADLIRVNEATLVDGEDAATTSEDVLNILGAISGQVCSLRGHQVGRGYRRRRPARAATSTLPNLC